MDKKQAEEEAMRKAKETQAAAGKSSGMSGRDLVSGSFLYPFRLRPHTQSSSHIILSGSKIPTRRKRKIGTCQSIVGAMVLTREKSKTACKTWTSGTAAGHQEVAATKSSRCTCICTVSHPSQLPHIAMNCRVRISHSPQIYVHICRSPCV